MSDEGMSSGASHPVLDTTTVTLDEPDINQIKEERKTRTKAAMKAVSAQVAEQVIPGSPTSEKDQAALRIQSVYRGHRDRKKYVQLLYQQFEKEEEMRLEKMRQQVEEGELLVENHKLQVEYEDNATTRRNRSRQYETHVVTIQRAWRKYKRGDNVENNNMSPFLSESEEVSEEDGAQAMSVSSPESSERNEDVQSDTDSTANVLEEVTEYDNTTTPTNQAAKDRLLQGLKNGIEPEPDSVASDYSEMADPIKEHLANVQIIQKEDLETGNTMFQDQFSVGQKITQGANETDEEFSRRLRKINYLSLAQEFAALKKVDADALPFGIQKGTHKLQDVVSPMSETSSEAGSERYMTDSADVTPMESVKDFVPSSRDSNTRKEAWKEPQKKSNTTNQNSKSAMENTPSQNTNTISSKIDNQKLNKTLSSSDHSDQSSKRHAGLITQDVKASKLTDTDKATQRNDSNQRTSKDVISSNSDDVDAKSTVISAGNVSNERKKSSTEEKLGDFDVYNIETTLPQVDWETLEKQLKKAAEEEQQKAMSRRNDREEIRRKLAMGSDDVGSDSFYGGSGGDRGFKKSSLPSRLQSGMHLHGNNLQICFMNEATSDHEGVAETDEKSASTQPPQVQSGKATSTPSGGQDTNKTEDEDDEDFSARTERLQMEAKMALAQVRPMAHMQLMVEKQMKKSPQAEVVGLPVRDLKKRAATQGLRDMNVAQLQVLVNDLHTQIENLNEELMQLLVDRDNLHMEQDSKLVDIEDLTRRFQEAEALRGKPIRIPHAHKKSGKHK